MRQNFHIFRCYRLFYNDCINSQLKDFKRTKGNMNKEFSTVGYYEPGFIHLRINTTEDLDDLNKLKDDPTTLKCYSNFFHEYIHFLQDITSTHGLLNFVNAVEHLRDANKTVREDGNAEF